MAGDDALLSSKSMALSLKLTNKNTETLESSGFVAREKRKEERVSIQAGGGHTKTGAEKKTRYQKQRRKDESCALEAHK